MFDETGEKESDDNKAIRERTKKKLLPEEEQEQDEPKKSTETPSKDRSKDHHKDTPYALKRNRRQRDERLGNKTEDINDLFNFQELKELKMKQLGLFDRFAEETKEAI